MHTVAVGDSPEQPPAAVPEIERPVCQPADVQRRTTSKPIVMGTGSDDPRRQTEPGNEEGGRSAREEVERKHAAEVSTGCIGSGLRGLYRGVGEGGAGQGEPSAGPSPALKAALPRVDNAFRAARDDVVLALLRGSRSLGADRLRVRG